MNMNIFEQASRLKLRFDTNKGSIGVEELWDLPLTSNTGKANLDDIARGLHRKLEDGEDVSFVVAKRTDAATELQFEVVKRVIAVRIAENEANLAARQNAERKQHLLSLIAQKENAALAELPIDELKKLAESM